ncbi:TadE/TadG family type IV pilus assembly protein [Aminobacter sp. HY435]|uniref:TadE/TadG family type IV pilus assembly protein n=1 Tax=Aminobacter sp. HY435 TaxID=2970917 RepID=UPI0022B968AF|nr:TadE/TadG family type IV pilus assembly protein [Aminobacter sp. HY435]
MDNETEARQHAKRSRKGFAARFMRDRSGSTAIEFVVLAIPFSLLVFAILESCISFAGQQVLSNATDDLARQLRTGQIRATNELNETAVKAMLCKKLEVLVAKGCPGLLVDLRSYPSFADAANVKIKFTNDRDIDTTGFEVKPGLSMSKNMLRVFYKWPVITDFMRSWMSNLKGGHTLQFATVIWQNEPFND